MNLGDALGKIDAIHAQMDRTRVFRGYKSAPVAATGALAFLAAALQPYWVPDPGNHLRAYLELWIGVAFVSAGAVAVDLIGRCLRTDSRWRRQETLRAVEQFVPCLICGACATWGIALFYPAAAGTLPGLWSIFFSLGVFASRRQLPASSLLVAIYYLLAGTGCLVAAHGAHALSPWAMAATFGVGQFMTAAVLHFGLERTHAGA